MPDGLQCQGGAPPQDPPGALQGPQLARVRQGTPAARQPHSLGHPGGARGLAPAPEDWSEGPATRLFGRGDRDWAPAAPGLWSALAANRRSAALTHDPARGEPRGAGPHHVFPAQPWPGARDSAGASPGERAGSRRDRRDRAEGLRRGRVAGGKARCARQADRGKRTWRKLHLAVDPSTGEILASELTSHAEGDASQVGPLLDQIPGPLASVIADGAYDGEPVYRAVAERQPDPPVAVIIPPRSTAVPSAAAGSTPSQRDQHIQMIQDKGRLGWQKAVGYGRRSLGEAT